jgi:hypothetical protein
MTTVMAPQQLSGLSTPVEVTQRSSIVKTFDEKDEAFHFPDTQKGCYKFVQAPSYNSPNPVNSNSYTTICISEGGNYITDIKSSFICMEVYMELEISKAIKQLHWDGAKSGVGNLAGYRAGYDQVVFIGWKSSIEAVQRYDLVINSQSVYTQNFVGEESFCWNQTLSDSVIENNPYVYTSYKNASKMDPRVCGAYILFKAQSFQNIASGDTKLDKFYVRFPIKIPIDNFYILRNMDTIHSWMGKWEIRLYFSPNNLVFLNIHPKVVYDWFYSYCTDGFREAPNSLRCLCSQEKWDKGDFHYALDHDVRPAYILEPQGQRGNLNAVSEAEMIEDWKGLPETWGWLDKNIEGHTELRWQGSRQFVQMHDKFRMCVWFGDEYGNNHHLTNWAYKNYDDYKATTYKNTDKNGFTIKTAKDNPYAPHGHWQNVVFRFIKMEMYGVEVVMCQDQIISEVNGALKMRYLGDRPFTIMVSIIYVSRFTGMPTMGDEVQKEQVKNFMMVLCQSVNNVALIMILPAYSHNQHTVFMQPWMISFLINFGEYGQYPVEPFNSYHRDDDRLNGIKVLHYIYDSLNFSRNKLLAMPRHLAFQYCPNTYLIRHDAFQGRGINRCEQWGIPTFDGLYGIQDCTNYAFYIPFSHPEVFQNGLSSPVNVLNIKFSGKFRPLHKKMKFMTPWMIAFVVHGILMIRPNGGGDNANVIFSDRTLMSNS